MRVFVINLARRRERMEFMRSQFHRLNVDFERVEAIDGAALPASEIERSVNRFRWHCAQGYRARNGEIGCALSHQSIYHRMIDENIAAACIVEDDVTLSVSRRQFSRSGASLRIVWRGEEESFAWQVPDISCSPREFRMRICAQHFCREASS